MTTSSKLSDSLKAVAPSLVLGTMFFDPFEHVGNLLKTPQLLGQVQSSLCWYADMAYMRELRNVFWAGFNDHAATHGIDDYNEFVSRMSEREFAQMLTFAQGFDIDSGPTIVRQLGKLRAAWYEDLNSQEPIPQIEDLLANEKPPRVGAIQFERLSMLAEHMADDKNLRKQYLDNLVARENTQAQFAHTNRQRLNPCLMIVASFCEATDTDRDDFRFDMLPDAIQKRLITAVPAILNNTILRMSRDRKMGTLEYSACMIEAGAAIKAFNKILALPRWERVEI